MKAFLLRWLITTIAVAVAAKLVPGIHVATAWDLILAALLLGIVNAFLRPILLLLSLPLILLTLGLFILVVNALMLELVSGIVPGFTVSGFGSALIGSILISIVSWILSAFFKGSDGRVHVLTHHGQIKQHNAEMKQAQARVVDDEK